MRSVPEVLVHRLGELVAASEDSLLEHPQVGLPLRKTRRALPEERRPLSVEDRRQLNLSDSRPVGFHQCHGLVPPDAGAFFPRRPCIRAQAQYDILLAIDRVDYALSASAMSRRLLCRDMAPTGAARAITTG
jgi:hypothetical protein